MHPFLPGCDLQVDVNGEEIFIVNKTVLTFFSGRFRKLLSKIKGSERILKVILQDFPGGAEGFELVTSFCYSNGEFEINPSNIALLTSAAYFMEIKSTNSSASFNLIDRTEKFLQEINRWSWSELLVAIKQLQDLSLSTNSSLVEKILDSLIGKLSLLNVHPSPYTCSSSDNFSSQLSSDTSSTSSRRSSNWWFEDLVFFNVNMFEKLVRIMVSQKLDNVIIFKFLVFYLNSKLHSFASRAEKREIMEASNNLMLILDRNSLSCKGLFEILRIVSRLKGTSKCCRLKLERLIGSKLDQATLDQVMIRSPMRKFYMYDVNLVLRLAESYLTENWMFSLSGLKKIGGLIDSYLVEVAPDFGLKPSKFAALSMVLPDSARESCDRLYQAIDLYLEVHTQLCEEEKIRLCSALNHEKLSAEALKHLAQNSKFPSRIAIEDFVARQPNHIKKKHEEKIGDIEIHLQQMQWRVAELEKVCKIMQSQSQEPNVKEPILYNSTKTRYLPKFFC